MTDDEVLSLIAVGRRAAADMFEQLDAGQLAVQSLCGAWTVQDMAGHLVSPFCVSVPRFTVGLVLAGGFDKYSVKATANWVSAP